MFDERRVPPFLLRRISGSSSDQKAYSLLSQQYEVWKLVYPNKPFDEVKARELWLELSTAHQERLRLEAVAKTERLSKAEAKYAALVRRIIEEVFTLELEIEDVGVRVVEWGAKIFDSEFTKKCVGTPSQLFNGEVDGSVVMAWHKVNTNCRKALINFLTEIRRRYDGFEQTFSFDRERLSPSSLIKDAANVVIGLVQGVEPEAPKYFSFKLRLNWKPAVESEVAKRIERIIHAHIK